MKENDRCKWSVSYCMRNFYCVSDRALSLYFRFRCILAVVYISHFKRHGCSCLWNTDLIFRVVVREATQDTVSNSVFSGLKAVYVLNYCVLLFMHSLIVKILKSRRFFMVCETKCCKILAQTVGNWPVWILRRKQKHIIKMDLEDLNAAGISSGELLLLKELDG